MNLEGVARTLVARPAKARSLIVTFFGDVVSVQPSRVWLGSLIGAMDSLGLSEHLVRTTCNRLVREGWLQSHRRGRRSYFGFSEYGARQYRRAAYRIYAAQKPDWDGYWTIVLIRGLGAARRRELDRELGWLGFGRAGKDTLVRAGYGEDYRAVLDELAMEVPVFRAQSDGLGVPEQELCRQAWPVDVLSDGYRQLVDQYGPLDNQPVPAPVTAFQLRLMLIHDYRRVVLTDPELPSSLLPRGWLGDQARELTASLYHHWLDAADAWLTDRLELEEGAWPVSAPTAQARFRDTTWTRRLVALA